MVCVPVACRVRTLLAGIYEFGISGSFLRQSPDAEVPGKSNQVNARPRMLAIRVLLVAWSLRDDVVLMQIMFGHFARGLFALDFSGAKFSAKLQPLRILNTHQLPRNGASDEPGRWLCWVIPAPSFILRGCHPLVKACRSTPPPVSSADETSLRA